MPTKTKLRRGIGWHGRVFKYGTAMGPGGARLSLHGPVPEQEENARKLNKLPEFKRAAKKAQRRSDIAFQGDQ